MGWFTPKACPNCGREIIEATNFQCPHCKTKLFDLEPEISNRIRRVTLWIAIYGWAQCVYWVLDTLVFWGCDQQETSFTLNGWLYSFSRLGIGVALICFAKQAKKHPDKVASYLFYTMWVLSVKLILMMCFDALFYHYHINQALGLQNSGATVCGIGILITLFKYVVNQKKAIRELKQQR